MNRVYVLPPQEDWIIDRMVEEWNHGNADMSVADPANADVVWVLADFCWQHIPIQFLRSKKVLTTVHHIVHEKFGDLERADFERRDQITTAYHVFNQRTHDYISPLTQKPIHLIKYWANQRLWRPTGTKEGLRKKHGLPQDGYLIGSFQRDTEGQGIAQGRFLPKREKGPDLLADYLTDLRARQPRLHVVLAGWRRQYLMGRLTRAGIPYTYFELPPIETINELYQTLDLYPVTARHEGGPQALIEAGLLGIPVVSRPVGIAEQVLPVSAINSDVSLATPAIPDVETWKIPGGFEPYRKLLQGL